MSASWAVTACYNPDGTRLVVYNNNRTGDRMRPDAGIPSIEPLDHRWWRRKLLRTYWTPNSFRQAVSTFLIPRREGRIYGCPASITLRNEVKLRNVSNLADLSAAMEEERGEGLTACR